MGAVVKRAQRLNARTSKAKRTARSAEIRLVLLLQLLSPTNTQR